MKLEAYFSLYLCAIKPKKLTSLAYWFMYVCIYVCMYVSTYGMYDMLGWVSIGLGMLGYYEDWRWAVGVYGVVIELIYVIHQF